MGKYLEMCFFSHADVTSPFPTCFFFLPFQLNFNNIRRLGHAFFPPKSGILQQYFELGHKDASRFLVREGLYEITKPGDRKPLVYESSVWRSRLCEDDDGLLYEDDLLYDEVVGVNMMAVFCMRMIFFMTRSSVWRWWRYSVWGWSSSWRWPSGRNHQTWRQKAHSLRVVCMIMLFCDFFMTMIFRTKSPGLRTESP